MSLPWVRLDANIASHDKILGLFSDPSAKKWQAFACYTCALGWSGGQGTDGFVPKTALPMVHGTPVIARLLEKYDLWDEAPGGWVIRNFAKRQQSSLVTESVRTSQRSGARKGNCIRHHGADCGCWKGAP